MKVNKALLGLAGLLVVVGVVLIPLQTVIMPEPESVCVEGSGPTSGFTDEEKGCPISIESYNEIRERRTSPKLLRLGGLLLILGGLGVGVISLFTGRKPAPAPTGPPPPPPPG